MATKLKMFPDRDSNITIYNNITISGGQSTSDGMKNYAEHKIRRQVYKKIIFYLYGKKVCTYLRNIDLTTSQVIQYRKVNCQNSG